MSFVLIEQFLSKLSKASPQDNRAYLTHCNDVWLQISGETTFLAFPSLLENVIETTNFLSLSGDARNELQETLSEIKAHFSIAALSSGASQMWPSGEVSYRFWARSIRQGVAGLGLTLAQATELEVIEEDLAKLKRNFEQDNLDPAVKETIQTITELFGEAIEKIRRDGLTDFALDRFFLFGRIKVILDSGGSDISSFRQEVEALGGKLWAFAGGANTAVDIGTKLLGILG
jgi:hypothetical protein